MSTQIAFIPVGVVHSPVSEAVDDVWGEVDCRIELDGSRLEPDCLAGLEEFSHVEIVFLFDRVQDSAIHFGARHPRGRTDWPKVGIFAQRAKHRPNRIGVTVCRLLAVNGSRSTDFRLWWKSSMRSTERPFSTSSLTCGSSLPADPSGSLRGPPS